MNTPSSSRGNSPRSKSTLRIAIVTETFAPEINGVAMTIGRMVEGLMALGHQVQVVRPQQSASDAGTADARFDEVLVRGAPIPMYRHLRFGLVLPRTLIKTWERWRPDLIHVVTEGPLGLSAIRTAEKLGLPLTSGFHTNFHAYTHHYGIGAMRGVIARYLRWIHNRTQATFVPTQALADELTQEGYCNALVVSRGVDCELFSPEHRSEALRKSWGAGAEDLVVLNVGRVAAEKNVELIAAAYSAISERNPTARMVFVGDGPMRESLQMECPDAIFAGSRKGEDLARHYASADMFLFPSLTETFGNVTTEALASGLAVVAFRHAAAAELIKDGDNGRLAPPDSKQTFIDRAVVVAEDAQARRKLREAAAESVAHLAWRRIHQRVADIMSAVVSGRQPTDDLQSLQQGLSDSDEAAFIGEAGAGEALRG